MSVALEEGNLVAGRYRLIEQLGAGGMGVVWKAKHTVTRRTLALKLMLAPLESDEQIRQRFLVEARAAAAVDHPNVVSVHDVFVQDDGTSVMVMDYLEGESLRALLEREGALSVERVADIFVSIVSAVGTAHSVGVLHRDLKPENVFLADDVDPSRRVRVLDFGLAKVLGDRVEGQRSLTKPGTRLGTPHYMSPEQASGSKDVDHRAEEWSIGVMLYEALAGMRPIEGAHLAQVYEKVLTEAITPLRVVRPQLPEDLLDLVDHLLMRSPTARPGDLREVLEVLARHASFEAPRFGAPGSAARTPSDSDRVVVVTPGADADARTEVGSSQSSRAPQRRPLPLAAIVAGVLFVTGLLIWAATREREAADGEEVAPGTAGAVPERPTAAIAPVSPTASAPTTPVPPSATSPSSPSALPPVLSTTARTGGRPPPEPVRRRAPSRPPRAPAASARRAEPPSKEIEGFVETPPF